MSFPGYDCYWWRVINKCNFRVHRFFHISAWGILCFGLTSLYTFIGQIGEHFTPMVRFYRSDKWAFLTCAAVLSDEFTSISRLWCNFIGQISEHFSPVPRFYRMNLRTFLICATVLSDEFTNISHLCHSFVRWIYEHFTPVVRFYWSDKWAFLTCGAVLSDEFTSISHLWRGFVRLREFLREHGELNLFTQMP